MRVSSRYVFAILVAIIVISCVAAFAGQHKHAAAAKGNTVTVRGEVVDMWCYMSSGAHGAGHKECAETCAKDGSPIGIVDGKGHVYVLVPGEMHTSPSQYADKMADTVTVTGKLVRKGGVEMIYVKSMS